MAAVGYLISLEGGRCDLLKLVKMLYYADRMALECWHRTITGDTFYSLENGPIVSTTYDLMKGKGASKYKKIWDAHVSPVRNNIITLSRMPDTNFLSDNEKEKLTLSFNKISPMRPKQLIDWMHTFPEWDDPKKSSVRIDPKNMLKLLTPLTNDAISIIEEEIAQADYVNTRFGATTYA